MSESETETETRKRAIPELSADTIFLLKELMTAAVGETVTYEALSGVIGRDVREVRQRLHSAVRKARNEHGAVFEAVYNVGMKRCPDRDIIDASAAVRKRIRRAARVHLRKLATVDYAALDHDAKVAHCAEASILSAAAHVTDDARNRKLRARMAETPQQLPVARSLEALK